MAQYSLVQNYPWWACRTQGLHVQRRDCLWYRRWLSWVDCRSSGVRKEEGKRWGRRCRKAPVGRGLYTCIHDGILLCTLNTLESFLREQWLACLKNQSSLRKVPGDNVRRGYRPWLCAGHGEGRMLRVPRCLQDDIQDGTSPQSAWISSPGAAAGFRSTIMRTWKLIYFNTQIYCWK